MEKYYYIKNIISYIGELSMKGNTTNIHLLVLHACSLQLLETGSFKRLHI